MKSGWLATDGLEVQMISTNDLEENKWIINLEYKTYDDQTTRDRQRHEDRRKRNKRAKALKNLATIVAKRKRADMMKKLFLEFNCRPENERSFEEFETTLLPFIENPSAHTVLVELDGESKEFEMRVLGSTVGAMEQLVIDEVIAVLTKKSDKSKSKKKGRRQQVSETRYGSCGNEKYHQMTLQNQDDLIRIEEKDAKDKSNQIKVAKRRLKEINAYNGSWESNGTVILPSSTKSNLKLLLNIFLIKGRADLKKKIAKNEVRDKVIDELENLNITKTVIDSLKLELIELIRKLGGEYAEPEQQQDSSRVRRRGRPRKEQQLTNDDENESIDKNSWNSNDEDNENKSIDNKSWNSNDEDESTDEDERGEEDENEEEEEKEDESEKETFIDKSVLMSDLESLTSNGNASSSSSLSSKSLVGPVSIENQEHYFMSSNSSAQQQPILTEKEDDGSLSSESSSVMRQMIKDCRLNKMKIAPPPLSSPQQQRQQQQPQSPLLTTPLQGITTIECGRMASSRAVSSPSPSPLSSSPSLSPSVVIRTRGRVKEMLSSSSLLSSPLPSLPSITTRTREIMTEKSLSGSLSSPFLSPKQKNSTRKNNPMSPANYQMITITTAKARNNHV